MSTPFPKNTASLRLNPYKHGVALQTNKKRFAKFCENCCQLPGPNVAGRAVECNCNGRMYYIGVFDGQISTLAHECAHIAFFLLATVGIDARNDSGEAFCYLLGFMMREFGPVIHKGVL